MGQWGIGTLHLIPGQNTEIKIQKENIYPKSTRNEKFANMMILCTAAMNNEINGLYEPVMQNAGQ